MRHLSPGTERSYVYYIRGFILYHKNRHPAEMGVGEIKEYLTYPAVDRHAAAATQNVAFVPSGRVDFQRSLPRKKRNPRITALEGTNKIFPGLLYGCGMRLSEAVRLRVKDVDFAMNQIIA